MKQFWKKIFAPVAEYYRDLRPRNIATQKYNHSLLLLFWAVYGFMFLSLERFFPVWWPARYSEAVCFSVHCPLDDLIPFNEFFLIPYLFWFAFLILPGIYFFLWEPRAFRDFQWAIILTYSVTTIIYILWPTKQELRPDAFPRDNFLTDFVRDYYDFDTNTNVCPSLHVLGALATMFAGLHSKTLRGWGWKVFFVLSTILISMSTVFLKQHSIVDVFAALGVGFVCYAVQFWLYPVLEKRRLARRAKKESIAEKGD